MSGRLSSQRPQLHKYPGSHFAPGAKINIGFACLGDGTIGRPDVFERPTARGCHTYDISKTVAYVSLH